jgi:hypothetical protein
MAPLPEELLTASSTLRELYGVLLFIVLPPVSSSGGGATG